MAFFPFLPGSIGDQPSPGLSDFIVRVAANLPSTGKKPKDEPVKAPEIAPAPEPETKKPAAPSSSSILVLQEMEKPDPVEVIRPTMGGSVNPSELQKIQMMMMQPKQPAQPEPAPLPPPASIETQQPEFKLPGQDLKPKHLPFDETVPFDPSDFYSPKPFYHDPSSKFEATPLSAVRTAKTPPFPNPELETTFQNWYRENYPDLNPNPDDPLQQYDYRAFFLSGGERTFDPATRTFRSPSEFKLPGHHLKNVVATEGPLKGQLIDSRTGEPVYDDTRFDDTVRTYDPGPEQIQPGPEQIQLEQLLNLLKPDYVQPPPKITGVRPRDKWVTSESINPDTGKSMTYDHSELGVSISDSRLTGDTTGKIFTNVPSIYGSEIYQKYEPGSGDMIPDVERIVKKVMETLKIHPHTGERYWYDEDSGAVMKLEQYQSPEEAAAASKERSRRIGEYS